MSNKNKTSIRYKLLIIMVGLILALLTTMTFFHYSSQKAFFKEELNRRIELMKSSMKIRGKTLSDNLARFAENAIAAFDFFGITQTIEKSVNEEKDLVYAILMDFSGEAHIYTQNPDKLGTKLNSPADEFALKQRDFAFNEYTENDTKFLESITPVFIGDSAWGVLRLGFSLTVLEQEISDSRLRMNEQLTSLLAKSVSITLLFVIIGSLLVVYSSGRITNTLRQLTEFSSKLANEDFDAEISKEAIESNDEIGELSRTFEKMAKSLKESYEQLADYSQTLEQKVVTRTLELKNALENLKKSQEQLVQSEKMAALGQLVAGVSHEINTPIGVGVTASTFLQEQVVKLKKMLSSEEIDEDELNPLIKHIDDSGNLIHSNLMRASELITSFKQTSADQTSQEKRTFNMHKVISDTMKTLHPELKKTRIKVYIDCSEHLSVSSYPGAVSQVITCFVMNSIIHGFENNNEGGEIHIDVKDKEDGNILIIYSDDGKGIPKNILKSVFDPFVTTKRGQGGTGLGLNVAFNVVNKVLRGDIDCESLPGKGATFSISMPIDL